MIRCICLLAAVLPLLAQSGPNAEQPPPSAKEDVLRFEVKWPSGLSLGEGHITSVEQPSGWTFSGMVDAGLPGFAVTESAKSHASEGLCSIELTKKATRGSKNIEEITRFHQDKLTAERETVKGGKNEFPIAACARDALTFLQHLRQELKAGRLPAQQTVYYGAGYRTRIAYVGATKVPLNETMVDADRLEAHVKGPASDFVLELIIARDANRTPISARFPLKMGMFRVEFSR